MCEVVLILSWFEGAASLPLAKLHSSSVTDSIHPHPIHSPLLPAAMDMAVRPALSSLRLWF